MLPIEFKEIKETEFISKSDISKVAMQVMTSNTPLQTYIIVKALEILVKDILSNDNFRKEVKSNFLEISGGALDKTQICGVTVKTVSLEKKNELAKNYEFTKEVTNLEKKINKAEVELKSMKTRLKEYKLLEINKGLATEISTAEITGEVVETDPLDQFNITITFD
jgi:hypothetical protein